VPDVLQVVYEYPDRGLTLTYNATLANAWRRGPLYLGTDATMDLSNGVNVYRDGDPGRPIFTGTTPGRSVSESFVRGTNAAGQPVDITYLHLHNWLEGIRSARPAVCNEDVGLREAVTVTMGVEAYRSGCRVRWESARRAIVPDLARDLKA
jgi:hypothetical protein